MNKGMSKILTCVYDNPSTMHREAWEDRKIIASISETLMMTKNFSKNTGIFFGLNVGRDFIPGRIIGNKDAINKKGEKNDTKKNAHLSLQS